MFGSNAFGWGYFADGFAWPAVPHPSVAAITGGGGGFPADWVARIGRATLDADEIERREIEELLALGLL